MPNAEFQNPPQMTAPKADVVGNFINLLKHKQEETRNVAGRDLKIYLDNKSREMSPENFSKFFQDVSKRLGELINSNDMSEKLGGIRAINEVISQTYVVGFLCRLLLCWIVSLVLLHRHFAVGELHLFACRNQS